MAEGQAEAGVHDVQAGLALVRQGLNLLLGARTWSLGDDEVRAALKELTVQGNRLDGARLALVGDAASRDDGTRPGRATAQWMQRHLRVSAGRAAADLVNARLVDPDNGDLRELGAALRQGTVAVEHVDVARRALRRIPESLVRRQRQLLARTLTAHAQQFTAGDAEALARHLLAVVAPDPVDRIDPEPTARRWAGLRRDGTGMWRLEAGLDGAGGAQFKAVFDHLAAPHRPPTDTAALAGLGDTRSTAQRGADALVEMARLAAAHLEAGTRAGEPARVVIHAGPQHLAWIPDAGDDVELPDWLRRPPGLASCEQTGPLAPGVLQRLACCAVLDIVILDEHGAIVEMRTASRYANRAQRRALAARDKGCAWPGCDRPPSWCDAHHVVWWTRGGQTVLANLVLLCPAHHTEAHAEEWLITVRDGVPWFVPPRWVDREQTPVRNGYHEAVEHAQAVGHQLRLDFADPPDPDPPPDG